MSWGAIYINSTQPLADVTSTNEGIKISREILNEKGEKASSPLIAGQKVTVRLTIKAERDLDFVEISDNRAACLEPVNALSGCITGYYTSPRDDKTLYFFDHLNKGKHVIDTDYYVDKAGDYTTGLAIVRCSYAPEYQGRCNAQQINVRR